MNGRNQKRWKSSMKNGALTSLPSNIHKDNAYIETIDGIQIFGPKDDTYGKSKYMIKEWLKQELFKPCSIIGYKGRSQMIGISFDFS